MVPFLSAAWVAALDEALRTAGIVAESEPTLIIRQVVDHPGGETTTFRARIGADGAEALPGDGGEATVTYRQSQAVARGIATGDLDAHVEFLMGRVVVTGDTKALVAHRHSLERMHAALRALRDITEF